MPTLLFEIRKGRWADGAAMALACVTGTLEADNLEHFKRVVTRLVRKDVRHLVLDLSKVDRVDLKGLGALEETGDLFRSLGGSLRVIGTELDDQP